MVFYTLIWFLGLFKSLCHAQESRYECGAHGKFEYCIDGIPGCVIGCHCHPGYFFDTDTKICEPNVKLTKNLRWRYGAEPTRIDDMYSGKATEIIPTPTTGNALDGVEDIASEADDLGDWLYNQFFKAIETQVINKTQDGPPDTTPNTRRSGDHMDHLDARSRRKMKNRLFGRRRGKKKRKGRVPGLRRKLLRITEDDSLFESDSGSDSESSEEGSSSSSDSSGETSNHKEKDRTGQGDNVSHDDHGHKKVIIYNRRPRPPLPSFIFLPNVDNTPYFPPLALPPPPVLPMYPLIPIPPVTPVPPCSGNQTVSSTSPSDTTTTTTVTTTTEAAIIRIRNDKHRRLKSHKERRPPTVEDETIMLRSGNHAPRMPMTANRMKHIQKLKEKWSKQNMILPNDGKDIANEHEAMDYLDESPFAQEPEPHKDFKYISQLIHKENQSDIIDKPDLKQPDKNLPWRRFNLPEEAIWNTIPQPQESNDTYYMNIGRQIANLIRNEEFKARNINKLSDILNYQKETNNYLLNENTPRSYWERYVRSPSKLKKYFDKLSIYDQSLEDNLHGLEDEVNIITQTEPSPSLQDLENILNRLDTIPVAFKDKNQSANERNSNSSYNVNLLPTKPLKKDFFKKMYDVPNFAKYVLKTLDLVNLTDSKQQLPSINTTNYLDRTTIDLPSDNFDMNRQSPTQYVLNKTLELENLDDRFLGNSFTVDKILNQNFKPFYQAFLNFLNSFSKNQVDTGKIEPIAKSPDFTLPVKYPESPSKYFELPTKYIELPTKYSEQPEKYLDFTPKYLKLSEKPSELTKKYTELPTKYSPDPIIKYPELFNSGYFPKYPEQSVNYPESSAKYSVIPTKNNEQSVKYSEPLDIYPEFSKAKPELSANYPQVPAKYSERLEYPKLPNRLHNLIENFPEMLIKYPGMSTKFSESSLRYPDRTPKYPGNEHATIFSEQNVRFPEQNARLTEQNARFPDQNAVFPEQNTRFSDQSARLTEQNARFSDQGARFSEQDPRLSDQSSRFTEHSDRFIDQYPRFPEQNTRFSEQSARSSVQNSKLIKQVASLPDPIARSSEPNDKYPEMLEKYREVVVKYPETSKYSDIATKYNEKKNSESSAKYIEPPTLNYKNLNFIPNSNNKQRFMYKVIPVDMSPYRKPVMKPSYLFHHDELRQFDFFNNK